MSFLRSVAVTLAAIFRRRRECSELVTPPATSLRPMRFAESFALTRPATIGTRAAATDTTAGWQLRTDTRLNHENDVATVA